MGAADGGIDIVGLKDGGIVNVGLPVGDKVLEYAKTGENVRHI